MLNLKLALLSIICLLLYRTPTGALRGNGRFEDVLKTYELIDVSVLTQLGIKLGSGSPLQ